MLCDRVARNPRLGLDVDSNIGYAVMLLKDEFQIILEERAGMTDVTINVEAAEGVTGYMVAKHLRERLGFLPKGDVFPIGALPRTEGKAKRVIKKKLD